MKWLKNFINTLKEHKKAVFVILFFLFAFIYLLILDSRRLREGDVQSPVSVPYTTEQDKGTVRFLSVTPVDGNVSTLDSFQDITFEFSAPLDRESIKVRILPTIAFAKNYDDNRPNVVIISPLDAGWKQYTPYKIIITGAKSVDGAPLDSRVEYDYLNTPPDTTDMIFPY